MSSPHLSRPFDPVADRAMFSVDIIRDLQYRLLVPTPDLLDRYDLRSRRREWRRLGRPYFAEVRQRYEAVRALKASVGGRDLTPAELDQVVSVVDCAKYRQSRRAQACST